MNEPLERLGQSLDSHASPHKSVKGDSRRWSITCNWFRCCYRRKVWVIHFYLFIQMYFTDHISAQLDEEVPVTYDNQNSSELLQVLVPQSIPTYLYRSDERLFASQWYISIGQRILQKRWWVMARNTMVRTPTCEVNCAAPIGILRASLVSQIPRT